MTSTATVSVRDKIKEANRIKRMRMGQDAPELVEIPGLSEVRVAMVPLTEAEAQAGIIYSAALDVPDNSAGIQARNRIAIESDVWHACREPANTEQKVWPSLEEMSDELDPQDVDYLFDQLTILMEYASPAADGITDEQLDELKKDFVLIDWSALGGRQWSALKLCLSVLSPELLAVKFSSSSSTVSSTQTSESGESISDASQS